MKRELLFHPGARFSELKKVDVSKEKGKYLLTAKGKEFANRMDTDSLKLEKQAKLAIAIHAVRIKNGKKEYLMHKRLKEPFFGWFGSQSGKIRWGENPKDDLTYEDNATTVEEF